MNRDTVFILLMVMQVVVAVFCGHFLVETESGLTFYAERPEWATVNTVFDIGLFYWNTVTFSVNGIEGTVLSLFFWLTGTIMLYCITPYIIEIVKAIFEAFPW